MQLPVMSFEFIEVIIISKRRMRSFFKLKPDNDENQIVYACTKNTVLQYL